MTQPKTNADARAIYEQNWSQARHVEGHRFSYTSIYSVITAAVLAFLSQATEINTWTLSLLVGFVWWMSLLGLLISIRVWADIALYGRTIEDIASEEFRLPQYAAPRPAGWTRWISLRIVFVLFYVVPLITASILLLAYSVRGSLPG